VVTSASPCQKLREGDWKPRLGLVGETISETEEKIKLHKKK
jgi:hypothetical protein